MIKEKIIREKIDGEWVVTVPEVVLKRLLEQSEEVKSQQAEIDSLSMAHDNMARELSLFKEKDKHELIKSNIALNKRVQELEEERDEWKNTAQSYYMTNQELRELNKRYREAINFAIDYLKNSDIRQVQLVVTALKSALEGEINDSERINKRTREI